MKLGLSIGAVRASNRKACVVKIGTLARLALMALCLCGSNAWAQQPIGNGIYICNGVTQAGPCQYEHDSEIADGGGGYTDNDYEHAPSKWEDRWGAIATDAENAKLGVAVAVSSKEAAETNALEDCKRKGGVNCKLQLAYYNQCAAMIVGDRLMNSWGAETIELAKQLGLSECERTDSNCRVYYSACSLPERVQ